MDGKQAALSHDKKKSKTGPPVLVVLDPKDSLGEEINFEVQEEVQFWVMNRVHIFYSEDGTNWKHGFGDFEGCLAKPEVFIKDGKKCRQYISLKQQPPQIHFTTMVPEEKDKEVRFRDFGIKTTKIELPTKKVVRPYPDGFEDHEKKFDFMVFSDGVKILKIPSKNVIYVANSSQLSYWESVIFQYSRGGIIGTLKTKEINSEPWTSEERENLKIELENRLGSHIATIKKEMEDNVLEPQQAQVPAEGKGFFAFGMSEDLMKSESDANKLPSQSDQQGTQKADAQVQLYKMAPSIVVWPTHEYFRRFNRILQIDMGRILRYANPPQLSDKELLDKIKEYLNQNLRLAENEINEISKHFHISYTKSESKGIMLAIGNALEVWRIFLSNYHSDLLASDQFDSSYIMSVKAFHFATGCDAYSPSRVPVHIYFQIKNWWKNLLLQYQREEIEKEVVQIEVIGFASKKSRDETDNVRLRDDRAWKTARALKMIMDESGINREVKLIPMPLSASSRLLPHKPTSYDNILPILYVGEKLDVYPNRNIFKQEGNYVMDLLGETEISVKEPYKADTDDPEDRISLVVFKRLIPEDVNQIVRNVVITNHASPIYSYKKIISHKMPNDGSIRMVVYVCPGQI